MVKVIKRKSILLLMFFVLLVSSGCAETEHEQGIVINTDNSGYIYSKNLMLSDFEDAETINFFNTKQNDVEKITKNINGKEYRETKSKVKFKDLKELNNLTNGVVTIAKEKENNVISLNLEKIFSNKNVNLSLNEKGYLETLTDLGINAKFKIMVKDKNIIDTSGNTVQKNKDQVVVWNLINEIKEENFLHYLKYSNEESNRNNEPLVVVNNNKINFPDQKAIIKNSRVLVPIRFVAESLGAEWAWKY